MPAGAYALDRSEIVTLECPECGETAESCATNTVDGPQETPMVGIAPHAEKQERRCSDDEIVRRRADTAKGGPAHH